jgi:PAN domain
MRTKLVLIVLTMFSWSAFAGDGINRPGLDYSDFNAPTWSSCMSTCAGESKCQAYVWAKPVVNGPGGHCWLKYGVPPWVKDARFVSGTRQEISETSVKAEGKLNRPGLDFRDFQTNAWETCQTTCAENSTCKSWTYVHPGVQGPNGHCWLKSGVARPVPDPNMDSGVMYTPPSRPID